jgi:hypothetical protein
LELSLVLTHLLVLNPETIGPVRVSGAGVITMGIGPLPTVIGAPAVSVATVIGVTVPEPSLPT